MDLGKWLRDRKKSVVNQWQNSTVLDAVSANTKADQARRQAQGPQTINQQASKTYGGGFSAPVNRVKDIFSADTKADYLKRIASTGLTESYDQQQKRLTDQAVNQQTNRSLPNQFSASGLRNVINRVAKAPGDVANITAAAIQSDSPVIDAFTNAIPGLNTAFKMTKFADRATDSKVSKAYQQKAQEVNKTIDDKVNQSQLGERKGENKWAVGAGQLVTDLPLQAATGGVGTARIGFGTASDEYNKARAAGKSNDYALGTGILQGGASAISEKIGMDRFLPGNNLTGNFLVKGGKRFLSEGLQEAQQQFTQNFITNKAYDKNQGLGDNVVESAVLGGLAGGAMSPVLDLAANSPKAPQQVKQEVVAKSPVLQQTGIPVTPGSLRERIQLAKDSVANKIAGNSLINNQVGAIPNPAYRAPFTQGEPGAELLNIQNPLGAKQGIPITNELGATIRKPVKTNTGSTLVEPSTPNQPKLKITDANNQSTFIDPDTLKGAARQSYESKRGQVNNQDTNYDPKVSIRMQKDYIEGRTPVKGDATTGEGAQLPGKGLSTEQKQAIIDKATLKDNQSGSVQIPDFIANIADRIKNSKLTKNEGGYAKNPFYDKKNDVAQDLTPEQSDFINNYANMLEDMGSGNGVTINPETNQRVSSNYRNPELGSGKVSKAEWFDQARKEIESGKGIYGASEDYKALATKSTPKAKDNYKYKNVSANGTVQYNELNDKNSFQDINGERHPFQSNAKITVKNYDGTNETKTITIKDIGSQKYFNDQLIRYGERGEIMGVRVDQSPALVTQKSSSKTKSPKPPVQDLPSISTRIAESKQKVQTNQSQDIPQAIQSTDTSASRSSNKASTTPNTANDTTGDALSPENFAETFGGTVKQAEKTLSDTPRFDAATRTDKGKDANKLFESMKTDAKINQATKEAQASGKELNFYAKKDVNGRSVGIEQFDPKRHHIEAGFVVDEQQNILGNHIKVDANGIQVNVGGKVVNMDSILGNPLDWGSTSTTDKAKKGRYKLSETMNRNIDNNAPSKEIANKTKNFLWSNKVKAEADMRTELEAEYKALGDRIKRTNKAKPLGVSKTQYQDDIFAVLNGDKTDAEIKSAYKENTANAILDYKKETRTLYDSLLQRVNTERVKFGQPEIQARKDYITHLQELNGNKGFVAEVYGQMKNSFADEGMGKTRNGVPGDIAGRTENFKPISKYNPFLQRRTGTKSLRDPYMAVQEYLQPALYNIHMTESGARARAIETAFRTAEQIKNTEPRTVLDEAKKITDKYKSNSDNAKLITGFQEYANALAGKTQRFDRQVVDSSDTAAKGLKGWQALQRTGGRATILGNVSSMLAQPLNQVVGLADAGPVTYMKGIASAVAGDPAIEKSAFIKARETEPTKAIRGRGEKILDGGSIPLQKVELASVKLMWHTQYQKALSQGLKGQEAIQQADLGTERLAAGRGIADKPELYRSTVANGVLQYTLEVNAQNKAFWQDLSPKQKATFLVASTATNTLMGALTGFEPLPDFLKAMFETGKDILDGEDDQNIGQELVQGGQRMLDQYARMNPLLGAPVNLLPQAQRKAIFGQDSDTGRFSGSTAPVQVVTNAVKAASDVTKGNYKSARDNILRDVPFGNQIRKTLTGAEMINRGYAVDSSGKKTFDAPTSPLGKAQALAFGPSATKPAREYYDKGTSESSGKSVATKDAQGNETTKDDFESISKAAFNSPKGKEFMALKNEDERKEYARQSPDNRQIYNDYKAMQKAFNGGDKLLAPGLDETSTKTLNKYDRMTPKAKENIFNRNKSAEYEYELASYNNKKANGETNLVDEINGQQRLSKLKATKDFDKAYRDLYSGLSKTEVYDLITSNPDGKKIAEQLLAIDDALVKAGNKAKFRDKYGNVTFAPKTSSGGRGGRSAKSTGQLESNSLKQDTLSKLNALLAGINKPVTGVKKVATAKPTLKKITVKK